MGAPDPFAGRFAGPGAAPLLVVRVARRAGASQSPCADGVPEPPKNTRRRVSGRLVDHLVEDLVGYYLVDTRWIIYFVGCCSDHLSFGSFGFSPSFFLHVSEVGI